MMSDLSYRNDDSLTFTRLRTAEGVLSGFNDIAPDLVDLGRIRSVLRGSGLTQEEADRSGVRFVISGAAFLTHAPTGICTAPVTAGQALSATGPCGVWMTDGQTLDIAFDTLIAHYGAEGALAIHSRAEAHTRSAIEAELACALSHRAGARFARWILRLFEAEPVIILNQAELARFSGLQRTSVCAAMAALQESGGIKVRRGRIMVRDPAAVEQIACACYGPDPKVCDTSPGDRPGVGLTRYHGHTGLSAN